MPRQRRLCLGFTSYRPETLPLAENWMRGHEAVFLEEPQTPGFEAMLRGHLSISKYLEMNDYEFPAYTERFCSLARGLFREGSAIYQIDPFLDELISIHEFFVSGKGPGDLTPGTVTEKVYKAEREWTRRLLAFYKATGSRDFDRMVAAVKAFARADALRGRLRDRMRAERIAELLPRFGSVYVEAGYIHLHLMPELLCRLPSGCRFRPVYITEPVVRSLTGRRQVLAPGDVLTILYASRPDRDGPKLDLLAARSLVYNYVVTKEEISEQEEEYPHTRDEIEAIGLADSLGYEQCRELFFLLKPLSTSEAKAYARQWIRRRSS